MGLDAVEIVMRAEEFYSTTFTDDEAAQVRTVGDLYRLICAKLDLTPLSDPQTPAALPQIVEYERSFLILRKRTPLPPPPEVLQWTPQSVWDTLVAILVDQQGLKPKEILYTARFVEDLGVD
jgi:acyl carrier protein